MATLLEEHALSLIRRGRAQTQAQLCELTNQNSSTISELMRRLRGRGLIETIGVRRAGRGRPATVLRFKPNGYVIGIDVDGAHSFVGILDFEANIVAAGDLIGFEPHDVSAEEVIRESADLVRKLMKTHKISRSSIRGLGIGVNGRLSASGVLEFSSVLPWRNQPLAALAKAQFGVPTFVTDRQQWAVAEYRYGAGNGSNCMLYFNVADGVSARPVINGNLYLGATGGAGQIGHIVVRPTGPLCGCGQRGCLEAYISGPAICYRIIQDSRSKHTMHKPPESLLDPARRHASVETVHHLVGLAEANRCRYSSKLLSEVIDLAGYGLAMEIASFGPDLVVVDGYIFRDRPELLRLLEAKARSRLSSSTYEWPQIVAGKLGDRARLMSLVTVVSDGLAQLGALTG